MTDPLVQYRRATARELRLRSKADEASVERVAAIVEMSQSMSYGQIAKATELSRSRVQQLIERGRRHPDAPLRIG
jgi:hypothetical protein